MSDVERLRRWYEGSKIALAAGIVVVILLMLSLLVYNSLQGVAFRHTQRENTDLIRSCVEPTGKCFKDAAKRQASVIGDPPAPINNVVILASYCARLPQNDTEEKVRACVLAGLR